jgi:hypothetical protein
LWIALAALLGPLAAQAQTRPGALTENEALAWQMQQLRGELALHAQGQRQRDETLDKLQREAKTLSDALHTTTERLAQIEGLATLSGLFLSAPPAASDVNGVAKALVFAPRLEVDTTRRHDTLFLKLRRIDPQAVKTVATLELSASESSLSLPIDRNGALYLLEWSTSEGFSFSLVLRDGASDQPAATVQVKPQQNEGRFLFVAARLD